MVTNSGYIMPPMTFFLSCSRSVKRRITSSNTGAMLPVLSAASSGYTISPPKMFGYILRAVPRLFPSLKSRQSTIARSRNFGSCKRVCRMRRVSPIANPAPCNCNKRFKNGRASLESKLLIRTAAPFASDARDGFEERAHIKRTEYYP